MAVARSRHPRLNDPDFIAPFMACDLVIENVPYGGEWAIKCACGEKLTFSYRDRCTDKATLLVAHGDGEARWELPGRSDENLLWAIGADDPLARWLDSVHLHGQV